MATATKSQNNIEVYNKNKIAELKAIHKFLNSVFGTATASSVTSKKSDKAMAAALEAAVVEMAEAQ